ncbi:uncharacterized protein LOC101831070 [Mesocricetus auratus]|uniref:Uncharacterized protein LOC101831070 n=1 Tax=Mesocricetus auratus TaxID=10036 RepID=A0ABM2XDQ9_MESAU|nr:uncharacterized protein LOC101831070 [Mesocricetus auratus]
MPRGQKSKLQAQGKCHQTEGETQDLQSVQAPAREEERSPHTKLAYRLQSSSKVPQRAFSTTESKGVSTRRSCEGANSVIKSKPHSSQASSSTVKRPRSSLVGTIQMVVKYMMHMYKMQRPILKADLLKIISKEHRKRFFEILQKASFNIEVVFGVDLKEVDSLKHSYTLVSKMNLPNNGTVSRGRGFPKTGLLMNLLGVIFLRGNCAAEEKIWEFLNKMKVYDGKKHFIFGEPRKLITKDLVKLKYLEYRQVPNSHPASYEFLWGPRAHAETSKMKILEFWAKINHTVPNAFQSWYDEALKDEEEKTGTEVTHSDTLTHSESQWRPHGEAALAATAVHCVDLLRAVHCVDLLRANFSDSCGIKRDEILWLKLQEKGVFLTLYGGKMGDLSFPLLSEHRKEAVGPAKTTMPRGHKSKARAREKRRQIQDEVQGLQDAQAKAAEKEESPSSAHDSGDAVASTSAASLSLMSKPQGKASTITAGKRVSRRSGKGAKGRREQSLSFSMAPHSTESPQSNLLSRKTGMLMQYLLCKYKLKQPMYKGEMLKVINKRFKEQFPDILKKASERIQLVFGLEVKQIKPNGSYYTLVSKLDPSVEGTLTTSLPFPQNGLLMPLLGVIFLNGNRASETDIWEFLNILGIYDGKAHIIFGEPRKLITNDLVKEKYLEYRKVVGSDPPSYEFLWGPRANAETTKMKVLEFLAKVNETVPQAFPSHYEEALRDQEERAQAEAVGGHDTAAEDKAESEATPGDDSCS